MPVPKPESFGNVKLFTVALREPDELMAFLQTLDDYEICAGAYQSARIEDGALVLRFNNKADPDIGAMFDEEEDFANVTYLEVVEFEDTEEEDRDDESG